MNFEDEIVVHGEFIPWELPPPPWDNPLYRIALMRMERAYDTLSRYTYFASLEVAWVYYSGGVVEDGVYLCPRNANGECEHGIFSDEGGAFGFTGPPAFNFSMGFLRGYPNVVLDGKTIQFDGTGGQFSGSVTFDAKSRRFLGLSGGVGGPIQGDVSFRWGTHQSSQSIADGIRSAWATFNRGVYSLSRGPYHH